MNKILILLVVAYIVSAYLRVRARVKYNQEAEGAFWGQADIDQLNISYGKTTGETMQLLSKVANNCVNDFWEEKPIRKSRTLQEACERIRENDEKRRKSRKR